MPSSTAANAAKSTSKKTFGEIEFNGETFAIERKPNTLLLAELANVNSGDPDAVGVLAEFFKVTLGSSYPAFRKAVFYSDDENAEDRLGALLGEVLEATLGRPLS